MKISIDITILCFVALSFAVPLINTIAERSNGIEAREWIDLEVRTGPIAHASPALRTAAHSFIDDAHRGGQLSRASAAGSSARTTMQDGTFHLDRQQPPNAQGQRKVAIQLNKVDKGQSSTIGQVAIHGHANPSSRQVQKKLKHSVTTGRETHINHPNSKKAQNIANNQAQHQAKTARNKANHRAGMNRAAKGQYKKGRK